MSGHPCTGTAHRHTAIRLFHLYSKHFLGPNDLSGEQEQNHQELGPSPATILVLGLEEDEQ